MSDSKTKTTSTIYIREDLSVLCVQGDQTAEFRLDPYTAMQVARDLMVVAIAACDREAVRRQATAEQGSSLRN